MIHPHRSPFEYAGLTCYTLLSPSTTFHCFILSLKLTFSENLILHRREGRQPVQLWNVLGHARTACCQISERNVPVSQQADGTAGRYIFTHGRKHHVLLAVTWANHAAIEEPGLKSGSLCCLECPSGDGLPPTKFHISWRTEVSNHW